MGLCGSDQTTQTTTSVVDPQLQKMAKDAYGKVNTLSEVPFEPYGGDRVAGFTPDQQSSFDAIRNMSGSFDPSVAGTAQGYVTDYATAPGQNINTSRIVDETGRLGAMGDYINPFIQGALNPAIRDMRESGSIHRNEIGSQAQMAGAFGDARHGIMESEQMEGETEAIGDLSGRMYADAWAQAMGLRGADEARFLTTDSFNAESKERELERMFSGAKGLLGSQAGGIQNWLSAINPQLAAGTQQQQLSQQGLNVGFEDYLMGYDHPYKNMEVLLAALSGQPYDSTETKTTEQPDNSLATLIGAGLGAFL